MVVLRDEQRIARMAKFGQVASLVGMVALIGGLIIAFTNVENVFLYQLLALSLGWIMSQIGIYLAQRYLRSPRPDEVLDEALRKVAKDGRLYHYLLPAPHVLLQRDGVIVLVPKFQGGNISVKGDKWKQTGVGLRRFFGQESLGNPTREAETMVRVLAGYISKHAPGVEEVPIGALIVFTTKGLKNLDVKDSRIPAMHYTKLKGFLRQQKRDKLLSQEDYEAIRAAFDKKAAHLIGNDGEDTA
ncbi:MAG: hypothetical protein ACE5E7_13265 [Anaerolineae bacterium]